MICENLLESIFDSKCEACVNPVNCVGVMGNGLALQFKQKYYDYYRDYRYKCNNNKISLGKVDVYETGMLIIPSIIVSFPTKNHYRDRSNVNDIENGLKSLAIAITDYKIKSIAIPRIGSGLGGLDFDSQVKPLIYKHLYQLFDCKIVIHLYIQPSK